MVNSALVALLVAASVISPTAFVLVDNSQTQMNGLSTQLDTVMNGTMGFFDNAWQVAQNFQNPDYHYSPSDLGNYTSDFNQSVAGK